MRALLDTCATANFISESAVKRLKLRIKSHLLPIGAINDMNTESKGLVKVTIHSMDNNFRKTLNCLILPRIANLIPSEIFPRNSINIPSNIRLADPEFHLPRPIDLLIGSRALISMFSVGQINLSCEEQDLYLQKTRLGWVVAGGVPSQKASKATCHITTLHEQLCKFWSIEEVTTRKPRSKEEMQCETHFLSNVTRDGSGRYIVRLPFRETSDRLGDSRSIALKRLLSLERKLDVNEGLKIEYTRVIEEYLRLGHMSVIENPGNDGYYMPHHAVIKESSNTTKIRVVFDASAKSTSGVSLNDVLMAGPTIQDKLFSHLIRFRTYRIVLTADIEKMYRQVILHEDDRKFQRILWHRNNKLETLQLNTLSFGVSLSPFLAISVMQKLAEDECQAHPEITEILKTHLYVDDLITGGENVDKARAIRDKIIDLLARGGFTIRQWASNATDVVEDLPADKVHAIYTLLSDHSLKTLGIMWDTMNDQIYYSTNANVTVEKLTKRTILSEIAKIFDPLGLLGPVILYAKKIMQDVWRSGVHWDESVPQSIHTEWLKFIQQLNLLERISFDRPLLANDCRDIQIHGFCDASNVGYGACIYVRSKGIDGKVVNRLLCSKSRVAPLNLTTIPRLELCGALVLARLYKEVNETFNIVPRIILWCDSSRITLDKNRTSFT